MSEAELAESLQELGPYLRLLGFGAQADFGAATFLGSWRSS